MSLGVNGWVSCIVLGVVLVMVCMVVVVDGDMGVIVLCVLCGLSLVCSGIVLLMLNRMILVCLVWKVFSVCLSSFLMVIVILGELDSVWLVL